MPESRQTVMLPELELYAGALLFEKWSERVEQAEEREYQQLCKKAVAMQSAITSGVINVETGNTRSIANIPYELIRHENDKVLSVIRNIKDQYKSSGRKGRILYNKLNVEYEIKTLERTVYRPMLILPICFDDIQNEKWYDCYLELNGSVTPTKAAEILTAFLFGCPVGTVHSNIGQSNKERSIPRFNADKTNERKDNSPNRPTDTELFLLAALTILCRNKKAYRNNIIFRDILSALKKSGYDMRGAYHLCRYLSMDDDNLDIDVELNWDEVKEVCDSI